MPIYEFKCLDCAEKFSELRKLSEKDDPMACPKCRSSHTERTQTGFAVSMGAGKAMAAANCGKAASCPSAGGFS